MKCPNCGNPRNIHRSKRKTTWEKFLSWAVLSRPYRCHQCNTRFWRLRFIRYTPPGARSHKRSRSRSRGRSRGRSRSRSRERG